MTGRVFEDPTSFVTVTATLCTSFVRSVVLVELVLPLLSVNGKSRLNWPPVACPAPVWKNDWAAAVTSAEKVVADRFDPDVGTRVTVTFSMFLVVVYPCSETVKEVSVLPLRE